MCHGPGPGPLGGGIVVIALPKQPPSWALLERAVAHEHAHGTTGVSPCVVNDMCWVTWVGPRQHQATSGGLSPGLCVCSACAGMNAFAFVDYDDRRDAEDAVRDRDGYKFDGVCVGGGGGAP